MQLVRFNGNGSVRGLGIKKAFERLNLSEVKMGRGSAVRENCQKIVGPFQNNVPQQKIVKTLNIPSFSVHNIVKRYEESGEISELIKAEGHF